MIRDLKHLAPARFGLMLALCLLIVRTGSAQKINFGAYTSSRGISLTVSGALDFGDNIVTNSPAVNIGLNDNCVCVQIDGDATRDITIMVQSSSYLSHGPDQIPFTCRYAYSNVGAPDPLTGKASAVEISPGVTYIIIPMIQRSAGVPAPPPTPSHGGYTAPKATVYFYLYGTFGPIGIVGAGQYTGSVNVYVNYTTY